MTMALTRAASRTRGVARATPAVVTETAPPLPTRAVIIRDVARLPPPPPPRPSGIERELAATGGFTLDCETQGVSGNGGSLARTVMLESGELSAATQSSGQSISLPLPETMAREFYLRKYVRVRFDFYDEGGT